MAQELAWQNVYWPLVGVALNTMTQPCGSVCGLDPKLHVYLRSSPIVCAFDTIAMLGRFTFHLGKSRSPFLAAKWTLADRNDENVHGPRGRTFDSPLFLKLVIFIAGPIYCFLKLAGANGITWTKVWAFCFVVSFFVVFMLGILSSFAREGGGMAYPRPLYPYGRLDKALGVVALSLQFVILAWVDLAAIKPHENLAVRFTYHGLRLFSHVVAMVIHVLFISFEMRGARLSLEARKGIALITSLGILAILLTLHIRDAKFTQMYFFMSIIIAQASWLLYWNPQCRELVTVAGVGDWQSVVAFDFFCRMFVLSLFWYAECYDPTGTSVPEWAQVFG